MNPCRARSALSLMLGAALLALVPERLRIRATNPALPVGDLPVGAPRRAFAARRRHLPGDETSA